MSPGKTDNVTYFDDASCSWLLHSASNFVLLEILEFRTEANFDFLTIYDGADEIVL